MGKEVLTAGAMALGGPMAVGTLAAGSGVMGGLQADRQEQKNDRRTQGKVEDASLRNEANYRTNRAMLMTGIEDFYKKKGWKLPESVPGTGTSRSLPGDAPLYPGYDIPKSDWAYEQQPTPTPTSSASEGEAAPAIAPIASQPVVSEGAIPVQQPKTMMGSVAPGQVDNLRKKLEDDSIRKALSRYEY